MKAQIWATCCIAKATARPTCMVPCMGCHAQAKFRARIILFHKLYFKFRSITSKTNKKLTPIPPLAHQACFFEVSWALLKYFPHCRTHLSKRLIGYFKASWSSDVRKYGILYSNQQPWRSQIRLVPDYMFNTACSLNVEGRTWAENQKNTDMSPLLQWICLANSICIVRHEYVIDRTSES